MHVASIDVRDGPSRKSGAPIKRAAKRFPVLLQGRIILGPERLLTCTLLDLSWCGARIRVDRHAALPDTFPLVIAAHDLRTVQAQLRWRRENLAGVAFEPGRRP